MFRDVPVDLQMFKTRLVKKLPGFHVRRDVICVVYATIDVWIPASDLPRRVEMSLHAPEIDELGQPFCIPVSFVTEVLDGEKVHIEGLDVPKATETSPVQEHFDAALFP